MKTEQDLNALIPVITDLVRNHADEVGTRYDPIDNSVHYGECGWDVFVSYRCWGDWVVEESDYFYPGSCELSEYWSHLCGIEASHEDYDTGEVTEFTGHQLDRLWDAVEECLN